MEQLPHLDGHVPWKHTCGGRHAAPRLAHAALDRGPFFTGTCFHTLDRAHQGGIAKVCRNAGKQRRISLFLEVGHASSRLRRPPNPWSWTYSPSHRIHQNQNTILYVYKRQGSHVALRRRATSAQRLHRVSLPWWHLLRALGAPGRGVSPRDHTHNDLYTIENRETRRFCTIRCRCTWLMQ